MAQDDKGCRRHKGTGRLKVTVPATLPIGMAIMKNFQHKIRTARFAARVAPDNPRRWQCS